MLLRDTGLPVDTAQFTFQINLQDGRALAHEYGVVLPDTVGYSLNIYDGGM